MAYALRRFLTMEPSEAEFAPRQRLTGKLAAWRDGLIPGPKAKRTMALVIWVGFLVFGAAYGSGFRLGYGRLVDTLAGIGLAALILVIARWTVQLIGWIGRWAIRFLTLWGLAAVIAVAFAWLYSGLTWYLALGCGVLFGVLTAFLGAA